MAFSPPTLDQAQSALIDALEPLTTGTINTPKQVWALEVLQLFAVSKFLDIPESGTVLAKEHQVELSNDQMIGLLTKWKDSGNMYVTMAHPTDTNLVAGINWGQLVRMILPLLLNEVLKRLVK